MGKALVYILRLIQLFWQKVGPLFAAWLPFQVARQVAKVPVRIAIMSAWAIFLAVVFTGLTGMGVKEVFNSNPVSGVSADVLALVCAVFPMHFFLGLASAYIVWRLTVMTATQVLNKVVLWIFGA